MRRENSTMLMIWLSLLVLCSTTPSLGASFASYRALQRKGSHGSVCTAWIWRRGPNRAFDCELCRHCSSSNSLHLLLEPRRRWFIGKRNNPQTNGGDGNDRKSLVAVLGVLRGGVSSGGYNYDDDYYKGPGGDEPYYYEDNGDWGNGNGRRGWGEQQQQRYDDDGRRSSRKDKGRERGRGGDSVAGFDLTGTITRGNKKYGVYALLGSVLLTMMGVSLMFEKNLIRLGNLGFVTGVALFIGPSNVVRYFSQRSKLRGTIIFALGFFFVFSGHPIIGLAVEVFGFLNLFGNMLPMVWAMAVNMPFVRDIIGSDSSSAKKKTNRAGRNGQRRSPRSPPARDYYNQGYGYEEDDWDNGGGWGYDDYDR